MGEVVKMKRTYTEEEIATALVTLQANGGKVRRTARALGIDESVLRQWRDGRRRATKTPSETAQRATLTAEKASEAAGAWSRVRDLTLERMRSLLESGKDIAFRDLAWAGGVATDKVQLLTGKPTERTEVVTLADFLKGSMAEDKTKAG